MPGGIGWPRPVTPATAVRTATSRPEGDDAQGYRPGPRRTARRQESAGARRGANARTCARGATSAPRSRSATSAWNYILKF